MSSKLWPRNLDPIAMPGDYVGLTPLDEIRRVLRVSIRPEIQVFSDAISLSANATSSDHEMSELAMPDGWLGQWRMLKPGADIPNGVDVQMDHGGENAPSWTTKNARGSIDHTIGTIEGDDAAGTATADQLETRLTEVYVWEDEVPYLTFTETAGATPSIQDMRFSGYVYKLGAPRRTTPDGSTPLAVPVQRVRDS